MVRFISRDLTTRYLIPFAAVMASLTVLVASLWPASGPATGNDKTDHFIAYATLMLLWHLTLPKRALWQVLFGVIAFGALIEFLQGLTSYRFASIADILANSIGAVTVLLALLAWQRRRTST